MARIVVVGGGIAGLTTALAVRDAARERRSSVEVMLLEASHRVGGNIRTDREEGFITEWGPNGYLDNVESTPTLVRRLGLESLLLPADASAAKRFIYRGGRLHEIPTGPIGFLGSPLLSPWGRLAVFAEPFRGGPPDGVDESVFDFARRRIGEEAARILVDSMVSGVFAGNARELSLASSFPKMAEMEREHGSLVRAMFAKVRARRAARRAGPDSAATRPGGPAGPAGTLTSFRGGLDVLTERLREELGDAVRMGMGIARLEFDPGREAWILETKEGNTLDADAVVLALPAPRAAPLLESLDESLAREVASIPTAGLAVVALGFDGADASRLVNGFGFLVPRGEGLRILGCLWDSSIFRDRAPRGRVLVRAMIGGAQDPAALELDDDALLALARRDLRTAMGLDASPVLWRVYRHRLGIAQYVVGHGARLTRIRDRLERWPGLWLTGSSYDGVSMNLCIENAVKLSEPLLARLAKARGGVAGRAAGGAIPSQGASSEPL